MSAQAGVGHGKVILFGEHSVVYGRPALAMGIARGARATASVAEADSLFVEPWGVRIVADVGEPEREREMLRAGFRAVLEHYPSSRPRLAVHAVMGIPGGAGLGGSAALSVAVIRALDLALGVTHDDEQVTELSLGWERVFHGNPSGIDSAMAARGGLMLYRKGAPMQPVRAGCPLSFVVGYSGEHGSTKEMVESVARQHARDRDKSEQIFDAIAAIVENGRRALGRCELGPLGQLMDLNQQLLNTLMLSTTKLEAMCRAARAAGALGAKLTGGGGGGCMLALAKDQAGAGAIAEALAAMGKDAFVVEVAQ